MYNGCTYECKLLYMSLMMFSQLLYFVIIVYARIVLLVDLRDFFTDLGSGGGGGSSENDQLTSYFQSFFINIKLVK